MKLTLFYSLSCRNASSISDNFSACTRNLRILATLGRRFLQRALKLLLVRNNGQHDRHGDERVLVQALDESLSGDPVHVTADVHVSQDAEQQQGGADDGDGIVVKL